MQTTRTTVNQKPYAPLSALGFMGIGVLSFVGSLMILLLHPQLLTEGSYGIGNISLAGLISFGFLCPFIFGAAIIIVPIMTGSSLFSDRLAGIHWETHALGLGVLVLGFGGMYLLERPYLILGAGVLIIVVGILIHSLNLLITASKENRWDPALLTLFSAYFWLGISAVLGGLLVVNEWRPILKEDPIYLMQLHAPIALCGFLWLSLLSFALKSFNLFLVSDRNPGISSWIGWTLLNLSLMAMVPIMISGSGFLLQWLLVLLVAGTLCYVVEMVLLWVAARRPIDAGLTGAFLGVLSGIVVLVWVVIQINAIEGGLRSAVEAGTRNLFFMASLGTAVWIVFGVATRLIPFVIWRIRCAPMVGSVSLPSVKELSHQSAVLASVLTLALGWGYLVAGLIFNAGVGIQLGAISLIISMYWFWKSIQPALKVLIFGIEEK